MSLAINPDHICAVLLKDGWHSVKPASFEIDAYEFVQQPGDGLLPKSSDILVRGGEVFCATGAMWTDGEPRDTGQILACPITEIQAVRLEY